MDNRAEELRAVIRDALDELAQREVPPTLPELFARLSEEHQRKALTQYVTVLANDNDLYIWNGNVPGSDYVLHQSKDLIGTKIASKITNAVEALTAIERFGKRARVAPKKLPRKA